MSRPSSRAEIVAAAEQLFVERGHAATLEQIAAAAGISKGGLLYHFGAKEDLRAAVCREVVDRLWNVVHQLVGPNDEEGALLSAYVRALTGDSAVAARIFAPSALAPLFNETPAAIEVLREDADRWRRAFHNDRIALGRSLVIRHSAEGAATAAAEGYIDARELHLIRQELLTMIKRSTLAQ
ncbi:MULTISPECIES: TetR/AcrR family transcriptional regulator [unclassified Microbacterium]|uniref:TetR/AcrR family transcriptional regulator n=1 Tax=unclassified Microbacterium TaxID=2609290 RepID=UPI000EAACD3D|nr:MULTISPECIES: TetR/AcrR family transcriptional regulator [unclassified Microbacterium]MBT2486734.1 TetR/AcrR family transcriptional regulator [Microbacterium sp. ISL-108]RKN64667.1 TetR/AcrR family transcriptional regulator [Microbacterium sp. CGR2]